jgi:hypothetical protein
LKFARDYRLTRRGMLAMGQFRVLPCKIKRHSFPSVSKSGETDSSLPQGSAFEIASPLKRQFGYLTMSCPRRTSTFRL